MSNAPNEDSFDIYKAYVCTICLERIEHCFLRDDDDAVHPTNCCHYFHRKCIRDYMFSLGEKVFRCPVCRIESWGVNEPSYMEV